MNIDTDKTKTSLLMHKTLTLIMIASQAAEHYLVKANVDKANPEQQGLSYGFIQYLHS